MVVMTPELKRAIAEAGGRPVRVEDEETHESYLLVKERPAPETNSFGEVPEGVGLAYDAFRRDLPEMLKDKKLAKKWALYHRGDRIAVGKTQLAMLREVKRRGLPQDDFVIFLVEPETPEEHDFPSSWQ